MKFIENINKKYFEFCPKTFQYGFLAGFLGFIFLFFHVFLHTRQLHFVSSVVGVFVSSLIFILMINEPLLRKIKYGLFVSVFSSLATSFGSYFAHNLLIENITLLFLMISVGFSVLINLFLFNSVIYIACTFIIGTGFQSFSFHESFIHGLSFFIGGICMLIGIMLTSLIPIINNDVPQSIVKRQKFTLSNFLFSLELSAIVILSNCISHYFHLLNGYWLPMTALLVFRPENHFSRQRIKHRFWGTFFGSFVGFPICYIENKYVLIFMTIPILFLIVVSVAKHYGSYVFFLTAMISILMNIVSSEGILNVEFRLINTSLAILIVGIFVFINQIISNHIKNYI